MALIQFLASMGVSSLRYTLAGTDLGGGPFFLKSSGSLGGISLRAFLGWMGVRSLRYSLAAVDLALKSFVAGLDLSLAVAGRDQAVRWASAPAKAPRPVTSRITIPVRIHGRP